MSDRINREDEKFGQRLQYFRELSKITQKEIAEESGLTKNYISSIERGIHKCNAKTFIVYAKKCGISLDILAELSDDNPILLELKNKISQMDLDQQQRLLDWLKRLEK